jgi:hypothetical protein
MSSQEDRERTQSKVVKKMAAPYMVVVLHHAPSEFEERWFSVTACFSYEGAMAVKQHVQRDHDDVIYAEIFGFVGDDAQRRGERGASAA